MTQNLKTDENSVWLAEDTIAPVHHCSNDERRDFLVDRTTEEVISTREADERATKRIEHSELGEQITEGVKGASDRKTLLKAAMGAGALMLAQSAMPRMAYAADASSTKTLIVLFLRGGLDGLYALADETDAAYKAKRPTLALDSSKGHIPLKGSFVMNKNMAPLMNAWNNGHLSFAHAVGDTTMGRSHFDEQARVDRMAPVEVRSGWLARRQMLTMSSQPIFRTYAANLQTPLSLIGGGPVFSTHDFSSYKIFDDGNATNLAVERMYSAPKGVLPIQAMGLFPTLAQVKAWSQGYIPSNGANYTGDLGRQLRQTAQIIKARVGLEVVTIDMETYDDHGDEENALGSRLGHLASNLNAFYTDMGSLMNDVTLVTQSEFGRTTRENGYSGTDHGRGNLVMCLSGKAAPQTIAGTWPGLSASATDANGDLEVTTDHRDVAAEVLKKHLGDSDATLRSVMPGHTIESVGLLR